MKLIPQKPKLTLNKAFLKLRPHRSEVDLFKNNLIRLLGKVDEIEREENQKNHVRDFLRDSFYKESNEINTKDSKDLVIHLGKSNKDKVGVIIEAKRPSNKAEMLTADKPNTKALQELVLYYLRERIEENNDDIKYLIATNVYEWFIIEASYFEKNFFRNNSFVKQYKDWRDKKKVASDTQHFYNEIAKPFIDQLQEDIPCTYFDIRDYEKFLKNDDKQDDKNLIALLKILSPHHLLKVPFADDSNKLDAGFYKELLHIIGLEEAKENGKQIIRRKKEKPDEGSLIENTIAILETEDLHKITDLNSFGDNKEDRLFNIALELCITWINRILFLKLLEGQLVNYHKGDKQHHFLNSGMINDYDELYKLFHQVLARTAADRSATLQEKYSRVPYLNSSLFEISELEDQSIKIHALDNSAQLDFINSTVLKDDKKKTNKLPSLEYLFKFLDAYDFASEDAEDIQEDSKTLINTSVLGKVFEKINGYKDGSIFTPGFITMYMCRQSIRLAIVQKFNDKKNWNIKTFDELYNKIDDINEANNIVNDLKLCDPAVGSGHYLVSGLNEIIVIKSELKILQDKNGKRLKEYTVEVENDELYVTDEDGELFKYLPQNKESQRIQETLFHEKQTIIENCLFGVDINPNSVKICQLRLWIELLKNAYYKEETGYKELETLPNIDINIKCGNSLLGRFAIDADLSKALKSIKYDIKAYRGFVNEYKNEKNREVKRGLQKIIDGIKSDFRINLDDPFKSKISKARGEVTNVMSDLNRKKQWGDKIPKELKDRLDNATKKLTKLEDEKKNILSNAIYKNAFEWRFEFPEVLNNDGEFEGFDIVIGNPPYIRQEDIKNQKEYLQNNYKTYSGTADLYVFFVEKGFEILKPKGNFSYIMPNKWMQAGYGKNLRSFLLDNQLISVIDFGDLQVFEQVTTYPCILNASKEKPKDSFDSVVVKTLQFDKGFDSYIKFNRNEMSISGLSEENWVISSGSEQLLLRKIKINTLSLFDYTNGSAHYGIKTGLTEAFLINSETKERLIKEDKNSESLIKPFLLGRNIKPYASSKAENWLILIPKGLTIKRNLPPDSPYYVSEPPPRYGDMPYDDAWKWFNETYPAIAKHLLPFKNKAMKRTDKGDFWWELRACDYYREFEAPKIMYQVLQVKPCFIYDNSKQYCNNSMWIIPKNDKFLVGLLNSKMGWWLISKYCTAIQNGYQLIWKYFGQIPIPDISDEQKTPIEEYVNQILTTKKQIPNSDTIKLEKQIDELVYKLYDLTADEIKIIESK